MKSNDDPAKFWRGQSLHHQQRADFWKKTSHILSGVLVGIILVTIIAVKVSS